MLSGTQNEVFSPVKNLQPVKNEWNFLQQKLLYFTT